MRTASSPLKIYYVLGKQTQLVPDRGDKINEISFLTALNEFSEVYYNNQRFIPTAKGYGLTKKRIEAPRPDCDLYIIRNNWEVFAVCPQPKLAVASPYDETVFREAKAVLAFTESWKYGLENLTTLPGGIDGYFHNNFPTDMIAPQQVINIGQTLAPHFFEAEDSAKIFQYKARMGYGFTVGYFGRIVESTRPNAFLRCYDALKAAIPSLTLVMAGRVDVTVDRSEIMVLPPVPFAEMPHAVSACSVLLANEQPESAWAGSIKPMEAMARGIPFLANPGPVRKEQLGEEYPLFYTSDDELQAHLKRLYSDADFYASVREYLLNRREQYTVAAMAQRLEAQLRPFCKAP